VSADGLVCASTGPRRRGRAAPASDARGASSCEASHPTPRAGASSARGVARAPSRATSAAAPPRPTARRRRAERQGGRKADPQGR
jgi:hypothetical protein